MLLLLLALLLFAAALITGTVGSPSARTMALVLAVGGVALLIVWAFVPTAR